MNLKLRFHPAAKEPLKAWGYAAFVGFMGGVLFMILNQPLIVALLLGIMIYNLFPYYLPSDYSFEDEGIRVTRWKREHFYKWNDYRSFTIEQNGIVLWAEVSAPSKDTPFREKMSSLRRSVFLLMSKEMLEQAEPLLRQKLALNKQTA